MSSVDQTSEAARIRTKTIWSSGNFGKIAASVQAHADVFMERLAIVSDSRILDLACGTGNLAILAAQRGARVSGIDIAPNLVAAAQALSVAAGLQIDFVQGDAEQLPYVEAAFDMVISMYGVMFAAHPALAAAELLRVCAPGGTIALANWTPASFIGQMLKTISAYVPASPGSLSPTLWGVEEIVQERLGHGTTELRFTPRRVLFEYAFSPAETVDFFIEFYGPALQAYAACSPEKQIALRQDLVKLWTEHNQAIDGSTSVVSEYLEVIATRV